jgi:hypothetical protein
MIFVDALIILFLAIKASRLMIHTLALFFLIFGRFIVTLESAYSEL